MSGKAMVKRNSDVELTLSLCEMVKFSAKTVEFAADKKKRECECKVLNIDIGGKNSVKHEWSNSSNACRLAEDNTPAQNPVTPTKPPTKPKGSSTKKE